MLKSFRPLRFPRVLIWALVLSGLPLLGPRSLQAGPLLVETEDFTLSVGLRLQPRLVINNIGGDTDTTRDFYVARSRIKLGGRILSCGYKLEWKLDNVDRIGRDPEVQLENGYIDCPLSGAVSVKLGLYDAVISRDRLTSDSKQIVVDRGAVSNDLSALGLADNATGITLHGRFREGLVGWAVGAYDNRQIAGERQDYPMFAARFDLNLRSSKDVFRDAHFGEGEWLSFGFNAAYQGKIELPESAGDAHRGVIGMDGMADFLVGPGRLLVRGELNHRSVGDGELDDDDATLWMLATGYLMMNKIQPAIRVDQARRSAGNETSISAGANVYFKGHNLKLQADAVKRIGDNQHGRDMVRFQMQVDF